MMGRMKLQKRVLQDSAILAIALFFLFKAAFPLCAASNKKNAASVFERAVEAQEMEDWYGASRLFIEAVEINPSYSEAWFRLSQCSYQIGQFDLALQYLDNAEKYEKGNVQMRNMRGMCYIALGRIEDARTIFTSIIREKPNDVVARFGLAELELLDGRVSGAQKEYSEALKRDGTNRKALLSLSFVAARLGKNDAAQEYMAQAMRYHSSESEVHYLAACLYAMQGNLRDAEAQARTAVELNGSSDRSYELLATVLYAEGDYTETIDICDFRIGRDRNAHLAWYLKGLSQLRLGQKAEAIESWNTGLTIEPNDEVMRQALELLATDLVPLEDPRRAVWGSYHAALAKEYARRFDSVGESYEYQRALRLCPSDEASRLAFARMLDLSGLHELYLEQIKFVKNNRDGDAEKNNDGTSGGNKGELNHTLDDTIEAYDSLLSDSLAKKWKVEPFYLDKIRWRIGIYYEANTVQFVHSDNAMIAAETLSSMFSGVAVTSVTAQAKPISGYGDAYRQARDAGQDYFIIVTLDEGSRGLTLDGKMYSGRTGTLMKTISFYSTGNNRLANVMRRARSAILENLPIRGRILDRSGKDLLVDVGKSERILEGATFAIVKKGTLRTNSTAIGLDYAKGDLIGKLTISKVGEEVSEGTMERNGFYDKITTGDEVVLTSMPEEKDKSSPVDNAPMADENGQTVLSENGDLISAEDLRGGNSNSFIDLIRSIY